jgi:hypothetical protein
MEVSLASISLAQIVNEVRASRVPITNLSYGELLPRRCHSKH